MEQLLLRPAPVVGRITEEHLSEAEKTFPGIGEMYEALDRKPVTFLQLLWLYEAEQFALAEAEALGN